MNALRQRLRAWWLARLAPTERCTLTQRNIYIVPTRAGLAFGATLAVLLLAATNYQLNLGYALTFLLAGSALASMHMTHASLRGLTLHLKPVAPCFAGEPGRLEVVFTNPGPRRHGLGLWLEGQAASTQAHAEVSAETQSTLAITLPSPARGSWPLPVLRLESRFPFGLFKAWIVWRPAGRRWVYPQPEHPAPALPALSGHRAEPHANPRPGGSELEGVRPWRRGDSPRQVVWKKVAHAGEMVSRDSREPQGQPAWIDWQAAQCPGTEARLSRLCAWVLAAEASGRPWGLRLPGTELPPAQGDGHRHAALQALAGWRA